MDMENGEGERDCSHLGEDLRQKTKLGTAPVKMLWKSTVSGGQSRTEMQRRNGFVQAQRNAHLIRFQCIRLSVHTPLEMEKMKCDVKILGKSWRGKEGSGKERNFWGRVEVKILFITVISTDWVQMWQYTVNGSHKVILFTNMPLKIGFELLETLYFCFQFLSPKLKILSFEWSKLMVN